jgi:FtsP/CotA-like multicopper oxidase with cupredoxin domain
MSLSRPYDLYFQDASGKSISFQVIASDSGLFGKPVTSSDVVIAMGERYEVVIDFSSYAGQNITLKNKGVPTITNFANTDKVMQFNVGNSVSDSSNNGAVPDTLNPNINWPTPKTSVDYTFQFQVSRTKDFRPSAP